MYRMNPAGGTSTSLMKLKISIHVNQSIIIAKTYGKLSF